MKLQDLKKHSKYAIWTGLTILFLVLASFVSQNFKVLQENPLDSSCTLNGPAIAVNGADRSIYIVDNSFQRILKINSKQQLLQCFEGGSKDKNAFYNCKDLVVDQQGNLYINNAVVDNSGMALSKESIIQYNADGSFHREIFSMNYDHDMKPLMNGWILSLKLIQNEVYFLYSEPEGIALYKVDDAVELVKKFPFAQARNIVIQSEIAENLDSILITTKQGEIVKLTEVGASIIYQGNGKIGESNISVPWDVAIYGENILFTDIGNREIKKITNTGDVVSLAEYSGKEEGMEVEASPIYKRLSVDDKGNVLTTDTFSVISLDINGDGYSKTKEVSYRESERMKRVTVYLLFVVLMIALVTFLFHYIKKLMTSSLSPLMKNSLLIFGVSIIISAIIGFILINQFNKTLNNQITNDISSITHLSRELLDGDIIEHIDRLEDYQSASYRNLHDKMNSFIQNTCENGESLYYVIYKTDGKNVYQCMDYINSSSPLNTMDTAYQGSYYEEVMKSGKQVRIDAFQDSTGTWTYAVGPIYNSKNETVGVIEVGRNLDTLLHGQRIFIWDTVLNILVITVIILLLFTESLYLVNAFKRHQVMKQQNKEKLIIGLEVVRPLTFTLFVASFLPTAFLPIYVSALYEPFWEIPKSLAIAIPLSAEVCASAIFAVIAGYMKESLKLKKLFIIGSVQVIAGFILCGIVSGLIAFTIGKFIVGMGMGFLYVATSTMIAEQKDADVVSQGYSDYYASYFSAINVGCVVGGGIATLFGYQAVFFAAAAISLLAMLLTMVLTNGEFDIEPKDEVVEQVKVSFIKFIFNPKAFALLFAIYVPYLIGTYFLYYFFPLFAFECGISESRIAQIFLLNGLFVVYLGPMITPWIKRLFGFFGGTIVGTLLCIIALSLFVFKPDITNAIICVMLLGIADSFAYTMQTTYYTGLKVAHKFGLSKANGIKNTVENIGYTVAPFAFGTALLWGNVIGVAIISAGIAIGITIFAFLGYEKKDKISEEK